MGALPGELGIAGLFDIRYSIRKAQPKRLGFYFWGVAERVGFEPTVEVSPHTRLAGERLQPTRPSLRISHG